ncbi:hypothetical protein K449DRAFT_467850 [Hypoxylon sp. EC38]|nr:hypothetical protein K449DRAFT_467850 [Hypoxylon sp. EC38]
MASNYRDPRRRSYDAPPSRDASQEASSEPPSPDSTSSQPSSPAVSEVHEDIPASDNTANVNSLDTMRHTLDTVLDTLNGGRVGLNNLSTRVDDIGRDIANLDRGIVRVEQASNRDKEDILETRNRVRGLEDTLREDVGELLRKQGNNLYHIRLQCNEDRAEVMSELAGVQLQQEDMQALVRNSQAEFRAALEKIQKEQAHLLHIGDTTQSRTQTDQDVRPNERTVVTFMTFSLGMALGAVLSIVFAVAAYLLRVFWFPTP